MSKKLQVSELADVATKGGAVGVASYLLSTWNVDPALNVVILPVLLYLLNAASTWVGDPSVANFFVKHKKVIDAVVKETVAKPTTVAQVSATKKAVAKKKKK